MYSLNDLDSLLPEADVVCMMLPNNPASDHLMNEDRIKLMKKEAILLNGGRGNSLDCMALSKLMDDGHLFGAGLDVTDPEPLPEEHPLWHQKRALITPHSAGGDHLSDTGYRVAEVTIRHLKEYLSSSY
jgi:phosphoglycerate dehydrogenase-like enzyme